MTAKLLEGTHLAAELRAELKREIAALKQRGRTPRLAAVLVGDGAGSLQHVASQRRVCAALGIEFQLEQLSTAVGQNEYHHEIEKLNADPAVHGIILQMPLPARLDAQLAQRALDPRKDAEGVHPVNLGLLVYGATQRAPCTAVAAYHLIKSTGVDLYGKEAVVIGHSQIVGKPVSLLLLHDFCTVTTCHIATKDLAEHARRAEVLVVAAGKPGLVTGGMIRPGAIVVDIGVNRVPVAGSSDRPVCGGESKPRMKTVGDVEFESAREVAGWITPVPGGVGPLTVLTLLRNVVRQAAEA